MKKFFAMFKARSMEFVRDKGTFFWNLLFPIVLVFGFAFAFSGNNDTLFKVGVIGQADNSMPFMQMKQIEFVRYDTQDGSITPADVVERLRQHKLDMVLDFTNERYYINKLSPEGPVLRRLFTADADRGTRAASFIQEEVAGQPIRFVDWLVPGVIGMNMMFSCLFGVGFVIVRYRKNGVLKRLKATPVSALNFVTAQAASRLVIVVLTSIFVYAGTNAFLHFMMKGSYINLLLLTTLAVVCMIAIGLVFASRLKSEELASGLLNLVTFPMIILSGVFFSLEGSPKILQQISQVLPLTHFVEGARSIMLEGAGFMQVLPDYLYLGGLTAALLFVSSLMFRWE